MDSHRVRELETRSMILKKNFGLFYSDFTEIWHADLNLFPLMNFIKNGSVEASGVFSGDFKGILGT